MFTVNLKHTMHSHSFILNTHQTFNIWPKLKISLFALYRPYIFGLGRSVGKMFYFFQALSLKKVDPAKQLVCTCM